MKISASIKSSFNQHQTIVQTNDAAKEMTIAVKPSGYGSSINGGELLLLSLATCFCNDIYRERIAEIHNTLRKGLDITLSI